MSEYACDAERRLATVEDALKVRIRHCIKDVRYFQRRIEQELDNGMAFKAPVLRQRQLENKAALESLLAVRRALRGAS